VYCQNSFGHNDAQMKLLGTKESFVGKSIFTARGLMGFLKGTSE